MAWIKNEDLLRSYVERIERADERINQLHEEAAAVYEEARWAGLNVRALKSVVAALQSGACDDIPIETLYAMAARKPDMSPKEEIGRFDPTLGFVYFAHFAQSGRLKIGFSTRVKGRMFELANAVGETPRLLAVVPGSRAEEVEALTALGAFRMRGEWFSYTPQCAEELGKYLARIGALREVS